MRAFYESTHWFWLISRIIFVQMFITSITQILNDGPFRHGDEPLLRSPLSLRSIKVLIQH